ncbi:NUDIX hydrolase [Paenibacillus hamazuiensis]|uniref:NUDIX hydrolase n=1 Tax=Paenibacillus hamazuiensis TaxID=2936508 RepID=UPI00200D83D4|nr:NUDIX hydrolase [Paenibacillus hamazuiensis]
MSDAGKTIIRGVKVVALHERRLVVVKQTRKHSNRVTYELPGGRVEGGETLPQAALRELREETGLAAGHLVELGTFTVPVSPVQITLYFTDRITAAGKPSPDEDEDIEVVYTEVSEAFRRITFGEWPDTRLGFGLILARSRGLL